MINKRRPLAITGLAVAMITFSLWLIYARFGMLRSLSSWNVSIDEVNITFISDISILSLSFIPLVLGWGLWQLFNWARAISICLFASIMVPSLLAAINLIPDRSANLGMNLAIGLASGIALIILVHHRTITAFNVKE